MQYLQIIPYQGILRACFCDDRTPPNRWTMPVIAFGLTERGIEPIAMDPKTGRVGDPSEWGCFESFYEDA